MQALPHVHHHRLLSASPLPPPYPCCQAYERVLQDGGPCRWFTAADCALLEQDVLRLKSLFFADGEGLPR